MAAEDIVFFFVGFLLLFLLWGEGCLGCVFVVLFFCCCCSLFVLFFVVVCFVVVLLFFVCLLLLLLLFVVFCFVFCCFFVVVLFVFVVVVVFFFSSSFCSYFFFQKIGLNFPKETNHMKCQTFFAGKNILRPLVCHLLFCPKSAKAKGI